MNEEKKSKIDDAGRILIEELNAGPSEDLPRWRRVGQTLLIPALAILTGLILGAILIIASSESVWAGWGESPAAGLRAMFDEIRIAYGALFTGSFGNPAKMIAALQGGDALEIRRAFNPFLEGLVASTPFIFAGLAVAFGFNAGLFNIGAEGQLFIGQLLPPGLGSLSKGFQRSSTFHSLFWLAH